MKKLALLGIVSFLFSAPVSAAPSPVVGNYIALVHANYAEAHASALVLKQAIDGFLANPSDETLSTARKAWIEARIIYAQTEAFRYYEGPIDFADKKTGESGPEGRLNAWPLNEAYIDSVEGHPEAGIVNNPKAPISIKALKSSNQQKDEKDVSTGYHAIEFLLWGQDKDAAGPGKRPYTDFAKGDKAKERRRTYLKTVTDLLVQDLAGLEAQWRPGLNYAKKFAALPENDAIGKILTGAASLAASELANERLNDGLISGDQEDEQSCFSDTTKSDVIYNLKGVQNVYLGEYGKLKGESISDRVKKKNAELDNQIRASFTKLDVLIASFNDPYDQILASIPESELRKPVLAAVEELHNLGDLLQKAGETIGASVDIVSE